MDVDAARVVATQRGLLYDDSSCPIINPHTVEKNRRSNWSHFHPFDDFSTIYLAQRIAVATIN